MSNVEQYIQFAEAKGWKFYHFTDSRNVEGIRKFGLFATAELRARNLEVVTGGNQWSLDADRQKGMDAYVHLCFRRSHPMEYKARMDKRIEKSCFLSIKPAILRVSGALISLGVSNKADAEYGDAESFLEKMDWEVVYAKTDWKNREIRERLKMAEKCEILIPNNIPLEYIVGL